MDTISVIADDSLDHVHSVVAEWVAPVLPVIDQAATAVTSAVLPAVTGVVDAIVGLQAFTGPQMFSALLLVSGAFLTIVVGAAVVHRYP